MENIKIINDNELEIVSGGIALDNFGGFFENDYDIVYKKDGEEPVDPTKPGTYTAIIVPTYKVEDWLPDILDKLHNR